MPSRRNNNRRSTAAAALGFAATAMAGPCDIYASGNTPCVAAHSTTRALYNSYTGGLYQVRRDSDGQLVDVHPLSAGGVANAATQDNFCKGTTCVITIIYDQSPRGNHLTQAPPGGAAHGPETNGYDSLSSAIGAPVTLNGQKAYGVFISPQHGYRNNNANGIAINDDPEGMYAVLDGTHYNQACCFDYGNAEPSSKDTRNAAMEAIYFGQGDGWSGRGGGDGPWIMGDLENGLFSGHDKWTNTADSTIKWRFTTAMLKGEHNHWAIHGGDATSGGLNKYYDGTRPDGDWVNMKKEGAIVLGIGGDNSNGAQGTFYEGVMTSGFPSDATDAAVQANIVAAKYAMTSMNSGPALTVGSSVSIRATTSCCTTRYLAHDGDVVNTQVVSGSSDGGLKQRASWIIRAGLGNTMSHCYSFESKDMPGSFIRHRNYQLHVDKQVDSKLFREDATFCSSAGLNGQGNAIRSWSIPTHFWRHYQSTGYLARNGGFNEFDNRGSFNDDVSWVFGNSFA